MSESIQSVLNEERVFAPPVDPNAHFRNMDDYEVMCQKFRDNFDDTWRELAHTHLHWHTPFNRVLNRENAPFFRWFDDGKLNLSYNCLDRHIEQGQGERTAIVWEAEDGEVRLISYNNLLADVCRAANVLLQLGIAIGDRVVIYMPMIPQAAVAMLACSRIGATHSVVFGAFSAQALRDRVLDAEAKIIITADGGQRRGGIHALKNKVDIALVDNSCPSVRHVVVVKRANNAIDWHAGRDIDWDAALRVQSNTCEPLAVDSEHPLFILYTSGSTGKPKGIIHATAGYLLWARLTMLWTFDFRPSSDVFWCTADIGWITGHTYSVYGPLACGGTTMMYEGTPTYPDAGRLWKICQNHRISIFYTAPTAIRALIKAGDKWPEQYNLERLRILGTVGEPINPEAWLWYRQKIGANRCAIVDTWWQTETGGHVIAPLPFATPTMPGSTTRPLPGMFVDILDAEGKPMMPDAGGMLVITKPWPAMLRGIWGDEQRYLATYWHKYNNRYYFAGDGARRDKDGNFWIMGRVDDVLNVSGHRLGTMEIESALSSHPLVAEAAVVSKPDAIKGESIFAFVVLRQEVNNKQAEQDLIAQLRIHVAKEIGPIAKPDNIRIAAAGLPKTRSGKIMRRLLRDIAADRQVSQDTSTLEDQNVIAKLQESFAK